MPLRELGSGHARLGETIFGHVPHEKSWVVWYFTEHDGVNCDLSKALKSIVYSVSYRLWAHLLWAPEYTHLVFGKAMLCTKN